MEIVAKALSIELERNIELSDIDAYAVEGDFIGFFVRGSFIWLTNEQLAQYICDVLEN